MNEFRMNEIRHFHANFCRLFHFLSLIMNLLLLNMINSMTWSVLIMPYSTQHRVWLVQEYHRTKNAHETSRNFKKHFNLPPPHHQTVLSIVEKFNESGSVADRDKNRDPTVLTPAKVEEVKTLFSENPTTSVRQGASVLCLSKSSVHSALQSLGMHPYKPISVQALLPDDAPLRLKFAHEFAYACSETQKRGGNSFIVTHCYYCPDFLLIIINY
jgi:Helix-turn-helix domain (DUF4817)